MEKPIKVLYFIAEYDRFGGSQKSLLSLVKYLPKDEVESIIVFPGYGKASEIYRKSGIRTEIINAPGELNLFDKQLMKKSLFVKMLIFLRSVVVYNSKIISFIRRNPIDMVHFNNPRALLMAFVAPKILGKPIVLHIRGRMAVMGKLFSLLSALIADRLILVSESLRNDILSIFRKKCITIHNLYDPEDLTPARTEKLPFLDMKGKILILIPSALVPFKGYHHLLRAIETTNTYLGDDSKKVVFIGIGESPNEEYSNYIKDLAKELNVDNFVHLGWQENPYPFYSRSDIVLVPSIEKEILEINNKRLTEIGNEGLPRALLEAMSFGKPIIGTNIAGIPELVEDGVNGLLVPPGDPEALSSALIRLISDEQKRNEMGKMGLKKAELFSKEWIIPQVLHMYKTLLRR